MLEVLYSSTAYISYRLIDFLGYEILLTLILRVDKNNNIKFRLDFGMSKFRSTMVAIGIIISLIIVWGTISDYIQQSLITILTNLGSTSLAVSILMIGLDGFWLAKVFFSRSWHNKAVLVFGLLTVIGSIFTVVR